MKEIIKFADIPHTKEFVQNFVLKYQYPYYAVYGKNLVGVYTMIEYLQEDASKYIAIRIKGFRKSSACWNYIYDGVVNNYHLIKPEEWDWRYVFSCTRLNAYNVISQLIK